MRIRPQILTSIITVAVLTTAQVASAGIFTYSPMNGDEDSGISAALQYTAKADFFGTGDRTVNGVTFQDTDFVGTGYFLSGPTNNLAGGPEPNNVGGGVGGLVDDFFHGPADGNATLTLTDLTIGTEYVTTFYNRAWGEPGGRYTFIMASDTPEGVFRLDQNFSGNGSGNVLRYVFTATADTQTFAFDAVRNADTFHHYAFTNAVNNEAVLPLPAAPVAPRITSLAADQPFTSVTPPGVSDDDLLQTQLASVSVTGTIADEGTGGVEALTNGIFTAGAGNQEYFTPTAGASVTFNLDITVNTLGYDITSVRGFGGWNDNGRDRQNYSLFYSVVGSDEFLFLGEVDFQTDVAAQLASTVTSIFDTSLTGVDAIRVDFRDPQENFHVGYGEFDVIGFATVPEPGTALLLASALPFFLRRRRRS